MTVEELHALGLDDARLAHAYREAYDLDPHLLSGNGHAATSRRREVFDRVMVVWYAPEEKTRKSPSTSTTASQ